MANRNGKTAHDTQKYQFGKTCPYCKKGTLVRCDQHYIKGHKHHVHCNRCKYENY